MSRYQFLATIFTSAIVALAVNFLVIQGTPAPFDGSAISVPKGLSSDEARIVAVVETANPAVISIIVSKDVPVFREYLEELPFGFVIPRIEQEGTEEREIGGGSGFLVSADGLAVTNRHVVEDEDAFYTAFANDGEEYAVDVVARDPFFDIAVVRLRSARGMPHLSFGDSDALKQGHTVVAIGNALGEFRNSVSVGVVSGLSRSVVAGDGQGGEELLEEVIQTDAAINPGNSGGPLLNSSGEVVGVNVAVALGSENIGFALPANLVKEIVSSVEEFGEIVRPYLGVRYVAVNEAIKEANNLSVDYGALVVRGESLEEGAVTPHSPADKAGIKEGDIILEFDGERLDEHTSLAALVRSRRVGDRVSITILHDEKQKQVLVTLEKAPDDK